MFRSHFCGDLRASHIGKTVTLSGWVHKVRNMGGMTFIDLRDHYGITQLAFNDGWDKGLLARARELNREYVIRIEGEVIARENPNPQNPTGEIEIKVVEIETLNAAQTPPFTIEEETDGGEELRMRYRYLDLRRAPLQRKLKLRNQIDLAVRQYLNEAGFNHIETPYLIKSTPEGARDFVVPSSENHHEFYALPQSPQTFKQLLMVSGFDRYYQIVRCFRDEDLRADRQPEFTQIDCEMSFATRDEIFEVFEGLLKYLLKKIKGLAIADDFPRISYAEAMEKYGTDKPDIRFGMTIKNLNDLTQNKGFQVFDRAESVLAISLPQGADYSRKQLDALTNWVKRPQIGMAGLIWCKYQESGELKSSVDKFFDDEQKKAWAERCECAPGDLMLILAGADTKTRKAIGELRLYLAEEKGWRKEDQYAPLWVTDFPLLEWDEETNRYYAMHHPFTAPKSEDLSKLDEKPGEVRAEAYDLVLNGNEIGGGSLRIYQRPLQEKMLRLLGFSDEEARAQFGFLMDAFEYGAPPHGGIAFGFDRLVALLGGSETIRDFIAFPKNNAGRDVMIDAPSSLSEVQLDELGLSLKDA